jgi:hypothetical protein
MAKIEPFEEHAQQYEDWFERNRFAYESELRAVKTLLPEGGNGMEVGVGSGRFAAPLGIRSFTQIIFHQPAEMKEVEAVRDGYGEGSFVVIKAAK